MKYPYHNFYEMLQKQVQKRGSKVALLDGDDKIRYRDVLAKVDRVAAFLSSKGIGRGDKVGLFLRNSPEFIYSIFAVSKLGAVLIPINIFLKSEELSYILEDSGITLLIASITHKEMVIGSRADELCRLVLWEGELEHTDEQNIPYVEALSTVTDVNLVASGIDDIAIIIYTSGTTGKPKGAMLSYKNILSNTYSAEQTINITHRDRAIVFLPMFHAFTFTVGLMLPLYLGASIVIVRSITPFSNIFKQTLTKRVTLFMGVPDVYNALAKAKLPWYFMWFNRVRLFISGAAALQPKTLEAMSNKFRRAQVLEGYGLSESSPAICINRPKQQKAKSVGMAMHGYEVKIVDADMGELPVGTVGDIIAKGDNIMQGYFNRPEATAETIINGWLLTGDMGYLDEDGFLFIVDRKKDLIISKGINIYPRELEEVIDGFDGVAASAVIGISDDKSGEIPIAYIELEEDSLEIDEHSLKMHMREYLANFKIPRQIHYIKSLPKNATGKVLKRELKEMIAK